MINKTEESTEVVVPEMIDSDLGFYLQFGFESYDDKICHPTKNLNMELNYSQVQTA